MMAAIAAASANGTKISITLLEKNEKLGKKLYITGKGRCNLTNATDVEGLMKHVIRNPRFLYSAFCTFDAFALMVFIEGLGVPLKTERGNRVFPVSDKANDINRALETKLTQLGIQIKRNTTVHGVKQIDGAFQVNTSRGMFTCDALILATGGLSYPATGSTGDGFTFANMFGHRVMPTYPSLVPLRVDAPWVAELEGLSLRNVRLVVKIPNVAVIYEETGEMLFTDTGVSGPLVLRASAYLTDIMDKSPFLILDMKPGLDDAQLNTRILRDFAQTPNKVLANVLATLLPSRMVNTVAALCNIPPGTKVNAVTKAQRQTLVHTLKHIPLTPFSVCGYNEAVITRGGIDTREIHPSTLMSKKIPGLFFAGECIDVDALTGGYNLQIAFSTGYLAGLSVAKYMKETGFYYE
jgi:hypothetical protein